MSLSVVPLLIAVSVPAAQSEPVPGTATTLLAEPVSPGRAGAGWLVRVPLR